MCGGSVWEQGTLVLSLQVAPIGLIFLLMFMELSAGMNYGIVPFINKKPIAVDSALVGASGDAWNVLGALGSGQLAECSQFLRGVLGGDGWCHQRTLELFSGSLLHRRCWGSSSDQSVLVLSDVQPRQAALIGLICFSTPVLRTEA
jgi:hypothetical protein